MRLSFPSNLSLGYFLEYLDFRFSYRAFTSLILFFHKNGNINLTKINIYIFFLKFGFFNKEIFIEA